MASKQPESRIVDAGIKALRKAGATAIKTHGDGYSRKGEPDVLGCYKGRAFAIEAKVPGEEPSAIQWVRMAEWANSGALVGVATCEDDFLAIVVRGEERRFSYGKTIYISLETSGEGDA